MLHDGASAPRRPAQPARAPQSSLGVRPGRVTWSFEGAHQLYNVKLNAEENVATGGAAINIAVGRHMRVNRNTVVSVGKNRFGTRYRSGNAGISFFNYIGSALYGDNSGDGNRVLWLSDEGPVTNGSAFSTTRRDVDQGGASLTNTVALTLPYATAEKTAYDDYMAMLATEGVSLGASWCK